MSSSSPTTPLQIGLIGAGNIGTALARHFHRLGHEVLLSNSRGPESLTAQASELGVKAVTAAQAAKARDIVVISVPQVLTSKLKPLFEGVPASVVVIDTNNYYPNMRDGRITELDSGAADSEWVSQVIGRPVIKTFNSIMAKSLVEKGIPANKPGRVALPVSGSPQDHKQRVLQLVDSIGFDAYDNGDLSNSWRHQPGSAAYCTDLDREKLIAALASAERSKLPEARTQQEEWVLKEMPEVYAAQKHAVAKHQQVKH